MARGILLFAMHRNDQIRPSGMDSGKLMMTMPMDMSQPATRAGTEVTMSDGLKNRLRNLLEFHACTHS